MLRKNGTGGTKEKKWRQKGNPNSHNSQLMTLVHKENNFSDSIQIPSFISSTVFIKAPFNISPFFFAMSKLFMITFYIFFTPQTCFSNVI